MRLRLYVDEDAMARAFVQGLRARGQDVMTVVDAGMSQQGDNAQLAYATRQGRVLFTFNVGHFCRLHADYMGQGRHHAGIIVVNRQRYSISEQIRQLLMLATEKSAEEMMDTLHFL